MHVLGEKATWTEAYDDERPPIPRKGTLICNYRLCGDCKIWVNAASGKHEKDHKDAGKEGPVNYVITSADLEQVKVEEAPIKVGKSPLMAIKDEEELELLYNVNKDEERQTKRELM